MSDDTVTGLLKKQNDLLDQIAHIIVDQQATTAQQNLEIMRKLNSMEGFLAMIPDISAN